MTVEHYPYGEESMGLGAEKTAEEESPIDPARRPHPRPPKN